MVGTEWKVVFDKYGHFGGTVLVSPGLPNLFSQHGSGGRGGGGGVHAGRKIHLL